MNYEAFFKLTYGLFIISSKDGDKYTGHISNTVFQVTAEPPRVTIASHKNNLTTDYIKKSKVFSASVLQKDCTFEFMGPWGFKSGRDINKFEGVDYKIGKTGAPIVTENCIAYYECEVEEIIEIGTHVLFIGKVVDLDVLNDTQEALSYAHYRKVTKGVSPKNSPTYLSEEKKADIEAANKSTPQASEKDSTKDWRKYRCTVCGYIYNPVEGDPPGGIPAGTSFDDIPDDWTCPICGVTKADFDVYE
jgi:flavin reductase (DIM6/NTAB) family NADH-FMN oxidoreductase RutF/rubredoxin